MNVKSSGKFGDRISLISPLRHAVNCPQSSAVAFDYYIQVEEHQFRGDLEVAALSEHRIPLRTLFSGNKNIASYNQWSHAEVMLPDNGSFYVAFIAVLGKPFVSDILIDDVIEKCVTRTRMESGSSVCCGTITDFLQVDKELHEPM